MKVLSNENRIKVSQSAAGTYYVEVTIASARLNFQDVTVNAVLCQELDCLQVLCVKVGGVEVQHDMLNDEEKGRFDCQAFSGLFHRHDVLYAKVEWF